MSLKESARRMFEAQYGVNGDGKTKVATQYLQRLSSDIVDISAMIDEKRQEATEEWGKKRETTLSSVKNNPTARAKLAEQLDAMKKDYDQAIRKSTGLLTGKKAKQEAANELATINSKIQAITDDYAAMDRVLNQTGTYSKANSPLEGADNAYAYSKISKENFIYKDDGVYVKRPSDGKEVRLSEYKSPKVVWDAGIETAGSTLVDIGDKKNVKIPWNNLKENLTLTANKLINDKNFDSLVFDDIGSLNFAEINKVDQEKYYADDAYRGQIKKAWKEFYLDEGKRRHDAVVLANKPSPTSPSTLKTPTDIIVDEDRQRKKIQSITKQLNTLDEDPTQPNIDLGNGFTAYRYKGNFVVIPSNKTFVYNKDNPPPSSMVFNSTNAIRKKYGVDIKLP